MNQASHYVDLLEWLIGPIADVQAMTATLARDIEVEDSAVLNALAQWGFGLYGCNHAYLPQKFGRLYYHYW